VSLDGEKWYDGMVIQQHHQLDDVTRTRSLRIEVVNTEDRLHPGQFVEAKIVTGTNFPLLAVPNSALSMIDGASIVFRLEGDHEFHAETVETGYTIGDWTVIEAGLAEGDQIAISGVFHLKSLQLKSSIGEGHAH
jgi:cobalt-zinc-cadmium efflux system membrane fusion protein